VITDGVEGEEPIGGGFLTAAEENSGGGFIKLLRGADIGDGDAKVGEGFALEEEVVFFALTGEVEEGVLEVDEGPEVGEREGERDSDREGKEGECF